MTSRRLPVLLMLGLIFAAMGIAAWMVLSDPGGRSGADPDVPSPTSTGPTDDVAVPDRARDRTKRPGHLRGEVRLLLSREPVAGVDVELVSASGDVLRVATDAAGKFEFRRVAADTPVVLRIDDGRHAPITRPGLHVATGGELDVGTLWLAAGVRVRVEVRSFTGQPLPSATVRAFFTGPGSPPFDAPTDPPPVAVAPTDADGVATFGGLPPGAWTFTAQKSGYARRGLVDAIVRAGVDEETFHLALERGHRLTGRVIDQGGNPVRGAPVLAVRRTLPSGASTAPLALRTAADDNGTFVLDGLPATDVVLWSGRPGRRMAVLAAVRIPLVSSIDLTLRQGGFVTGTVFADADDAPVAGATVTASLRVLGAFTMPLETQAEADGSFVFNMPMPGHLSSLSAEAPGHGRIWADLGEQREIALPEGARATFDLRLSAGRRIIGTVTGPDGPLEGVTIGATNPSSWFEVQTTAGGRYELPIPQAGRYFVVVDRWGLQQPDRPDYPDGALRDGTAPERFVADLTDAAEVTIDVELISAGVLRGRVEAPDGQPAPGALVAVPGLDRAARAGDDGRFTLEHVARNLPIDVEARLPGVGIVRIGLQEQALRDLDELVLRLAPWPHVQGRVSPAAGRSLEGAFVQILPWEGSLSNPVLEEWSRLETPRLPVRADGTFDHPLDLHDTGFLVRAGALGHGYVASGRIEVVAGQELYPVDLVLPDGANVSGRVMTTSGAPVSGAWISAVAVPSGSQPANVDYPGAWGPPISAISGPGGEFTIPDVADGALLVQVRHVDHLPHREVVDVPLGEPLKIELAPALSLVGTVAFEDGGPVEGVTVVAAAGSTSAEGRTDADGGFRIVGLSSEPHTVEVRASGGSEANILPTTLGNVVPPIDNLALTVRRGLAIRGRVESSDGAPLADTYVRAGVDIEDDLASTLTDRSGRFTLRGLEPGVAYEVRADGEAIEWAGMPVVGNVAAGTDGVVLRMPRVLVTDGTLVDASGAPVPNTTVAFNPFDTVAAGVRGIWRDAQTDEDGRFTLVLPEGARFRPILTGHYSWTLTETPDVVAGAHGIRLVAGEGATISGRLIAPSGETLEASTVYAAGPEFTRASTSDDTGAFRITGLVAGAEYDLSVDGAVWATTSAIRVAAPGDGVDVRVEPLLSAGGRVLRRDGSPWAGTYVNLRQRLTGSSWGTYAADDGVFRVGSLRAGIYDVVTYDQETRDEVPLGEITAGTLDAVFHEPAR